MLLLKFLLFAIIIGFFIYFYKKSKVTLIAYIAFLLPFPLYIELLGRDALTIDSFLIILFFINELANKRIDFKFVSKFQLSLIIIYIISFLLSLFSLESSEIIEAFRWVIYYLSGIMLFFLFLNNVKLPVDIYKVINALLISFVIQVALSIIILNNSNLMIFQVFFTRTQTDLVQTVEEMNRISGLIGDYELFAEILAVLTIYSLWMFFALKKKIYLVISIFLFYGILLTITRSAIILVPIGFTLFFILTYKTMKLKIIIYLAALFFIFVISFESISKTEVYANLSYRFEYTKDDVKSKNKSILEIMGRQEAQGTDRYDVKLIGTGKRFKKVESLHSLYLALIHQTGILGFLSYTLFLISLSFRLLTGWYSLFRLRKSNKFINYKEVFFASVFAFITILMIIINEFKVEHLRYSLTTEFTWLIFAIANMTLYFKLMLRKPLKQL